MKLVVGLGNPGREYEDSRHNIGFMCVSYLAKKHHMPFDHKQGKARVALGKIGGEEVVIARPQTFMNLSGESVSLLVNKYRVQMDDLVVIHDDLDLPPGKIRIRRSGGSAGHKGINSIIACLGTDDFIRVRVGIGRPDADDRVTAEKEDLIVSYVLSAFLSEEKDTMTKVIATVAAAVGCLISDGLPAAMNRYN